MLHVRLVMFCFLPRESCDCISLELAVQPRQIGLGVIFKPLMFFLPHDLVPSISDVPRLLVPSCPFLPE